MSKKHSIKPERKCSFPGCENKYKQCGLCGGHYLQQYSGKELTSLHLTKKKKGGRPRIICDEVYCPNHDLYGPCHVYRGSKGAYGYCQLSIKGKGIMVHRYCWEKEVGPIPEGLVIDHMCRNRSCCNIDHLRVVTQQVNSTENCYGAHWMKLKAMTHCKNGHPFGEDSLIVNPSKTQRRCKICRAEWERDRRIKKKQEFEQKKIDISGV